MVSVRLPSDALLQHLPSYLGFLFLLFMLNKVSLPHFFSQEIKDSLAHDHDQLQRSPSLACHYEYLHRHALSLKGFSQEPIKIIMTLPK